METRQMERLKAAGIDAADALERLLGSEALFLRFLGKFLADENYGKLEAAMKSRDPEGAVAASHTLKGVCGNLSMMELHLLFTRQVEALRGGDWAAADALMEEIRTAYEKAAAAIRELSEGRL